MNLKKLTIIHKLVGAIALTVLGAASANAAIYNYSGTVTLCTGTCDSFAALALGSTITGPFEIDTTPGGSFGDADVGALTAFVTNPALPPSGPVGDPVTDNPLVLSSALGVVGSNGTAGTTDADNEIDGGQLLLEFLVPPFSSNGAYVVFDLATGDGQVCLFYATAGCLPGATQAVIFEGAFTLETAVIPVPAAAWLFGSALFGLAGIARRKAKA